MGEPRNVVVFEHEDVKLVENGDVLTRNLMEVAQIKRKPGRFKTKVNFHKDMSSDEVRSVLEENFPLLHNRRFSCAARGTQNNARLEFHGVRRVWDGKTIKSKLKGSSVLYLVMEDEPPVSQEAFCGTESASSMQGHSRYSNDNSENNQQMSQLLTHFATITSSGGTRYKSRANLADNSNLDEDIFGSSLFPGSFDCEMEGDLPQLSPGDLDLLDETGSTQSKRQSQIGLSYELYRDLGNHWSDHWIGPTIGLTDQTSGPMTLPAFNPAWIGTVGAIPPNAEVLAQSQPYENQVFEACSTDTSPRRDSGFSSEGSSSMDQAIDLSHSIPREAGVEVKPSKGPLEGGEVFELTFDKSLPDAVTSALATFGNKQVEVWKTYEGGFVLYGKSIPPGEVPGTVPVTITTKNGAYLGKTEFTYVNQYEETLKQIVQSRSLQGQLFKMLSKQCENDESEENNTQLFGLPSDGRQRQAVDILRCLVYTAAGIGAEEFIRMIFSTSTGRIVFEAYKNESPLPEDIADANGHEEIATFLQAITKRFSEEETTSQTRSEGINWHELARAVEESEEQSVAWRSKKDVKQLKEDDLFEREYFGDGETSFSDSEKERCDNEDQFAARFSEVSVTEEDEVQPASDLSLVDDCCDTSAEETIDPRKSVVTEMQLSDISDDVGTCWRELGLKLRIAGTNLDDEYKCNRDKANALLNIGKQQEGNGALAGHLADALESIGRKSIAEKLLDQDPIQIGLDPSHQLTERDIHDYQLPEKIGDKWRDLARALKYSQANIDSIQKDQVGSIKECCITVLVRWMGRKGRNATVKKLAEALIKVELKNVADELMSTDTSQNDRFNKTISQMQTNCRHLEEEGSKMRLTIKEQEEKLSVATQKYQDAEREGSEMRTKIKQLETRLQDSKNECTTLRIKVSELEEDLAIQRQQQQDNKEEVQEAWSRNRTDPGGRKKQTKPLEGATSSVTPPASDEEVGLCLKFKQRSTMRSFFRPRESKDNVCLPVSYRTHRDS